MRRRVAALALLLALPAMAQTPAPPAAELEALIGTKAVSGAGREVGTIENLLVGPAGDVRAVVLEWGGALGVGERRAAVPMDRVSVQGNRQAVIDLTREQLEQAPHYDPDVPAVAGVDEDVKPLRE